MKSFIKYICAMLIFCSLECPALAGPPSPPVEYMENRLENYRQIFAAIREWFYRKPKLSPVSPQTTMPTFKPPSVAKHIPSLTKWNLAKRITESFKNKFSFITKKNFETYRGGIYKALLIGIPIAALGATVLYIQRKHLQKLRSLNEKLVHSETKIKNQKIELEKLKKELELEQKLKETKLIESKKQLEQMEIYEKSQTRMETIRIQEQIKAFKKNSNMNLLNAAFTKNINLALLALKAGADPNIQNENNYTPLIVAIMKDHNVLAQKLLSQKNIKPNLADKDDNTPLHWAVMKNNVEMVQELLKHPDIDLNLKNKIEQTAHQAAEILERTEILDLFTDHINLTNQLKRMDEKMPPAN